MNTLRKTVITSLALAAFSASALGQEVLYDNGPVDGSNGYSNADVSVFGFERRIMDDFTVPAGETWNLNSFSWLHIWDTIGIGPVSTGVSLAIRLDNAGIPGADLTGPITITGYTEVATGASWFGREEHNSVATFDTICLTAGTYWYDAFIIGPDNNYWMVNATVNGSEAWVNFEDITSGMDQSGSGTFGGAPLDTNFILGGERSIGTNYCSATTNSSGNVGKIIAFGSEDADDADLTLVMMDIAINQTGYFLNSMNQASIPVADGNLCLGSGKGRHTASIANSGGYGTISVVIDINALPRSSGGAHDVLNGETWYFQGWFRDSTTNGSNFTDAVGIMFN